MLDLFQFLEQVETPVPQRADLVLPILTLS
jgi:hypothetical protein